MSKTDGKNLKFITYTSATITIGIKCGVKLMVTFECAASDNPCSISGAESHDRNKLMPIWFTIKAYTTQQPVQWNRIWYIKLIKDIKY